MPKKLGYNWNDPSSPPVLEEHSKVKHDVIRYYLERYISVLCSDPRHDGLRINLIDGFSGGGHYRSEIDSSLVDGSPLLLINTVKNMERKIQLERKKPFRIHDRYYFIEKNKATFESLKTVLSQNNINTKLPNYLLFNDTFVKILPSILSNIQTRSSRGRCLFLLDQYGYSDVPLAALNLIFSSFPDTAEVILTFSTDSIVNYLSNNERFMKAMYKVGLEGIFSCDKVKEFRESPNARLIIEQELYKEICLKSGARYFTPFFIKSRKSHRSYWLLHLSSHPKARNEMCEIHWQYNNNFVHHGGAGLNGVGGLEMVLGYDPKLNDLANQNSFEFVFDDDANSRTYDCLSEEIPTLLSYDEQLTFSKLFSETCNGTPANAEHYRKAIYNLYAQGVIQILSSSSGRLKRPKGPSGVKDDSVIVLNRQIGLF